MKRLNPEYIRSDDRGTLTQINTNTWEQVNLLEITAGKVFGGHYHKHKTELFYVISGTIKINGEIFEKGGIFLIEPMDMHTIEAIEDSVIVELLSLPYDKNDIWANSTQGGING